MAARHVTEPEQSGRSDDPPRVSRSTAPIRHGWPTPPSPRTAPDDVLTPARPVVFDGGAGNYLGVSIVGFLITLFSLGLLFPLAYVMRLRWRVEHTVIEGRRLRFTGTGLGLFRMWLKSWFFVVITLGIYGFWVRPRLERWACAHTELAPAVTDLTSITVE
jgi:uncharacterized membrane protein YjgN (DUF898 family)